MINQLLAFQGNSSRSNFALVSRDCGVLSEHETTADCVRALIKRIQRNPEADVSIYRRGPAGWTKY